MLKNILRYLLRHLVKDLTMLYLVANVTCWYFFSDFRPINRNCWKYSFSSNSWVLAYQFSTFDQGRRPGVFWNGSIYLLNDGATQGISLSKYGGISFSWKGPPIVTGEVSCMVVWNNTFINFGGTASPQSVQVITSSLKYNAYKIILWRKKEPYVPFK